MSVYVPGAHALQYSPPKPYVHPKNSEAHTQMNWLWNESKPEPYWNAPANTAADANDTAKAWLAHPANKMQVLTKFRTFDDDGDGVTSKTEFKKLLKAAGLASMLVGKGGDEDYMFNLMDKDGDGVLSEDEIKALGQDSDGRAARRGLA